MHKTSAISSHITTQPANFIDGKWRHATGGRHFENLNPATGEVINVYPESSYQDLENAVKAAEKAFPSWRNVPAARRGEILFRAGELLRERKSKFSEVMTREMGKILQESEGDIQEAIDTAYYFAGEGRRLFGRTTTSELTDKFAMSLRMPVGVCGLIAPWNFPMAIPAWKIFPALVCGNTVVFKPASNTPDSAKNLVQVLDEAGLPAGVLNLVYGSGPTVGTWMLEHPKIRLISFTGSCEAGSSVGETCGKLFKKCSLELGGKNAQIVMEDADLKLALEGALWGSFGTTGQRCTATSRIIVHEKVFDDFKGQFVSQAKALRVGNGLELSTRMGPLVSASQLQRVMKYIHSGKSKDKAELLTGGEPMESGEHSRGFFLQPTVFQGTPDMTIAREEIFGPVTVLIKVHSFEEAIAVLNGTDYGLSGSIYTRDIERVMKSIRDMETGITYINAPTIGAEVHLPFGGVKHTGNGHREAGEQVLDVFSEWKTVYIDYSGKLQKAQMGNTSPPFLKGD